jgi:hypothetical protein
MYQNPTESYVGNRSDPAVTDSRGFLRTNAVRGCWAHGHASTYENVTIRESAYPLHYRIL